MPKGTPSYIAWRFYFVLALIAIAVLGLIWRVYDLAILKQHFLRSQGDQRMLRMESTPAFRGMILDRNGYPLAVSTSVYSIWINPQECNPSKTAMLALSKLLEMKPKEITVLIQVNLKKKKEFVYLKRSLAPEIADKIKALTIPGVYTQEEYRRYYPEGEVTAHAVGFTNVDDHGQEGLELMYNQWLQGEPGKKWVIKDRLGRVISDVQTVQEQKPGHDIVLSIDRRIQYIAYRELLRGLQDNKAASASAIVLDVKTGEVLAMVNLPSFNPNNRAGVPADAFRNRAVTDTFEPGSTIKAFSIASAIDTGKFNGNTLIDTSPGWTRVGHNLVQDEHNNGVINITQILQVSSNVGVTKIILQLPPDQLWGLLHRVGFGEITNIGFPGEQSGSLVKHNPWGAFTLATLAFGYGVSVTPVQLARAYDVIANNGVKIPLSLLRLDHPPTGERVMNENVAKQMQLLLEAVVSKGATGELASVPGYRVAGKTGTAKIAGEHGYQKHHYVSTFIGMAPLSNPRYIVAVVIHNPQGKNFLAGMVSAPVFERIMEGILRLFSVPPDKLEEKPQLST
jgi:cell division protein FtsI (penicillin-binding protein 3)